MARHNLVRVVTATVGTGNVTLGAAVPGFLTFSGGGAVDGEVVTYGIADAGESEVGIGTYSAGTLTRDVVLSSTDGGAKISLSGSAQVFITQSAEEAGRAATAADAQLAAAWGAL